MPSPYHQQTWIDMAKGRRSFLAFVVICLFAFPLYGVMATESSEETTVSFVPFVLPVLLALILARRLPRMLTRQGISVGPRGIDFVQEPKWWFRGRTLSVPWNQFRGFFFARSRSSLANNSATTHQHFSAYLYRTPPRDLVPTWLTLIAEGMDRDKLSGSPLARVTFTVNSNIRKQVYGALRAYRPDMLLERPPLTQEQTVPERSPGAPTPPDTSVPPSAPVPPAAQAGSMHGSVNARGSSVFSWFFRFVPASVFFLVPLLGTLQDFSSAGAVSPQSMPEPFVLLIGIVALLAMGALIVHLPRFWTPQGVHIDPTGITITAEPMWWFRGHHAVIPWRDIHHIAVSVRSSGSGRTKKTRQLPELHLHRVDHEMRLPRWAFLVMAGRTNRGHSASRPLVVVETPAAAPLLALLRRARPDLF